MYLDYNVTGDERKRLVKAIAAYTQVTPKYLGAPTFAYEVDTSPSTGTAASASTIAPTARG